MISVLFNKKLWNSGIFALGKILIFYRFLRLKLLIGAIVYVCVAWKYLIICLYHNSLTLVSFNPIPPGTKIGETYIEESNYFKAKSTEIWWLTNHILCRNPRTIHCDQILTMIKYLLLSTIQKIKKNWVNFLGGCISFSKIKCYSTKVSCF